MLLREILRQSAIKVTKNDVCRRYCVIQLPESTLDNDSSKRPTQNRRTLSNKSPFRDPLKKANTREVEQFGSWDLRMNFPLLEEQSIKRGTPIPLLRMDKVGFCTHQGRREYQEDRFNICQMRHDLLFLAVWDGHGGDHASEYCHQNVKRFLERHLEAEEKRQEANDAGKGRLDLGKVLRDVLLDLNSAFERQWTSRVKSSAEVSSSKKVSSPGTTATVILIRDNYELVVGHIGDSKAILCRESEARCLTKEHKPSDPEESARIESSGGQVTRDGAGRSRVNHRLAMSRSIGDFDLKSVGVIAEPDVARISIKHGKDKFLVLMTDGVSDVLSDPEIVKSICECENPSEAAERLVDQALLFSCEDNATVLIVPFGSWGKNDDEKTSLLFSLGRNMSLTSRYN